MNSSGSKFDNININFETTGASFAIDGVYTGFTVNGSDFSLKKVESGEYSFVRTDDGLALDLSNLTSTSDTRGVTVDAAGGAIAIYPPDNDSVITIGDVTYNYTLSDDTSEAYFQISSDKVTGFVLASEGDAITLPSGESITIYDAEDLDTAIVAPTVTGGKYTITKEESGFYAVKVYESSTVKVGDVTMDFTVSKATKNDNPNGVVTVYFDDKGELQAVDGLDNLDGKNDQVVVSGAKATSDEEGFPVGNLTTQSYIAIGSGNFTYKGNDGDPIIELTEASDTVYATTEEITVIPGGTSGTITDAPTVEVGYKLTMTTAPTGSKLAAFEISELLRALNQLKVSV